MKKTRYRLLCAGILVCLFCFSFHILAQATPGGQDKSGFSDLMKIIAIVVGVILAVATFIYNIRKDRKIKKIKQTETTGQLEATADFQGNRQELEDQRLELQYREALRRELGNIGIVGPAFDPVNTDIEQTFTDLRISEAGGCRPEDSTPETLEQSFSHHGERDMAPDELMVHAFARYRLLLIIGDPGSGKTTLLKHYAVTCLDPEKKEKLGFNDLSILPLYFPLRELQFDGQGPLPLHENLAHWAGQRHMDIDAPTFHRWLKEKDTLVLLDGLDEISSTEKRKQVCAWLKNAWTGLGRCRFVFTSRPTGYRRLDDIQLECEHLRGDILDFSPEQQAEFLKRWFDAVYLAELPAGAAGCPRGGIKREANRKAQKIIQFLEKKENKAVRELARVPMLLQIMAIIWKNREFLPGTRSELYNISLDYLLEYRDRRRNLNALLPARSARTVLAPMALWMQEGLRSDNAPKKDIHEFMAPILETLDNAPTAGDFCQNLRDRAGLIADYADERYIFRHKSFMEYLAGLQLVKESLEDSRRAGKLAKHFNDPWWEETLRFYMCHGDVKIFDRFMRGLFQSKVSQSLDGHRQDLLENLAREAPEKKIDGLVFWLNSGKVNHNQRRYILDSLKTIGSEAAIRGVEEFLSNNPDDVNAGHAGDIVAELAGTSGIQAEAPPVEKEPAGLADTFRNPFEDNVEYIRIPGATYNYSRAEEMVTVPDFYMCKYPVTNKRYRRFISYLQKDDPQLLEILPFDQFARKLTGFAGKDKNYSDYLGTDTAKWAEKFCSSRDDDKKFNGGDHPVVGISWYAARAYCFWLSCLEWYAGPDPVDKNVEIEGLSGLYRLPKETEWEWAAGGEPDGSVREYPWPSKKGGPVPGLANYGGTIGATTPVDRYPEGATPSGLMDMAGNVWEWMENVYKENSIAPALCGGSWFNYDGDLRCRARYDSRPHSRDFLVGFRPLRPSPRF